MKSLSEFKKSLSLAYPPDDLSIYLKALWYDAKGNWQLAHEQVDNLDDLIACWVHAYLHRKEGDLSNADYWYRKAHKTRSRASLDQEWTEIITALL
jgi:hypothetical protein